MTDIPISQKASTGTPITFNLTLTKVLPDPTKNNPDLSNFTQTYGPFHLHEDGLTTWYHLGIDTTDLTIGQYSAEIVLLEPQVSDGERLLRDFNKFLFNPSSGNFQGAAFTEYIPDGALTGEATEGQLEWALESD